MLTILMRLAYAAVFAVLGLSLAMQFHLPIPGPVAASMHWLYALIRRFSGPLGFALWTTFLIWLIGGLVTGKLKYNPSPEDAERIHGDW